MTPLHNAEPFVVPYYTTRDRVVRRVELGTRVVARFREGHTDMRWFHNLDWEGRGRRWS